MHHELESILFALAVGAGVVIAAKRARLPYNVALVVVGLLAAFAGVLPRQPLSPDVVLYIFLPALVFEAALFADADQLSRARGPILLLAIPGVAISLLATGAIATWALDLPIFVALLLGALLAITDTVSVLVAFRAVRVPHRLAAIMEGESLFNDGTALVLVALCSAAVQRGELDWVGSVTGLVLAIVGGSVIGGALGALGAAVMRRAAPDHLTVILSSVVLVFGTSLLAERAHTSFVIAVVVAGMVIGRAARRDLEPSRLIALQGFWETAGFGINVFLFLLVGMQIDTSRLFAEASNIGLALVALHAGRAVAVYGSFAGVRRLLRERVPMRWQHVMVVGNVKGALSMAAVLALPIDLPFRERLVTIVFGVTLVTLLTQGLPFKWIVARLGIAEPQADLELERARATLISAKRGLSELGALLEAGLLSRKEHAEESATLQRDVIAAEHRVRRASLESGADPRIAMAVLLSRKAAVADAARRGILAHEVAEVEIAELDERLVALAEGH
ncbi:MAG: sodium:proton antiporter [Polyangiaceae bacterium]